MNNDEFTMTESKDKHGNPVWTFSGDEAEQVTKAFFPDGHFFKSEKISDNDIKFNNVISFIFTYLYPAIPFLQLGDQIGIKWKNTQELLRRLTYLITRIIVGAPFFLSGMVYIGRLFNEGWRVYSTNAFFGILLVISYFFTSINPILTQQAIWLTVLIVYVLGYYQLFIKKIVRKK